MKITTSRVGGRLIQPALPCLAALGLVSGCAVFKAPPHKADGPTVATGVYASQAEKWQDEALAAQRKAEKEKTEKELKQLDRT